jgi:hypothetical protein
MYALNTVSIFIAISIIIFLICITLVIFAPKSQNFFKDIPGLDELSKNADVMQDTFVRLGVEPSEGNISQECEALREKYLKTNPDPLRWLKFPDEQIAEGDLELLPLMLSSEYTDEKQIFASLAAELDKINGIQSVYFIKMKPGGKLKKHTGWAQMSNNTLRYIYCFNSFCYSEDECGIWVNGEAKKLFKGCSYIYDGSKEHSIYNNIFDDVVFLIVDIKRPEGISPGYSEYKAPFNIADLRRDAK